MSEETCTHCGKVYVSRIPVLMARCSQCNKFVCVSCVNAHNAAAHTPKPGSFSDAMKEQLRRSQESAYSFTYHINIDHITVEHVEEIFRRFSTSGPYARAQSTREATPNPLSKEVQTAFATLGIPASSPVDEIKKAFKAKALLVHPDRGGNHAEMVNLNQAKEIALAHAKGKRR